MPLESDVIGRGIADGWDEESVLGLVGIEIDVVEDTSVKRTMDDNVILC